MRRLSFRRAEVLALAWFLVATINSPGLQAAEPPPAPILMPTTATVPAIPPTLDPAALPPPHQAALETVGMTPAQEARYRALTRELRCPLCQNQSIADSDAPISADLRDQVRARILAGASDDDIRTFVTDRFGEFALYRPRFGGITLWLWLAPLGLLLVGGGMVLARLKSRPRPERLAPFPDRGDPVLALPASPATDGAADVGGDAFDTNRRLARLLDEEGVAPATPVPPTPDTQALP